MVHTTASIGHHPDKLAYCILRHSDAVRMLRRLHYSLTSMQQGALRLMSTADCISPSREHDTEVTVPRNAGM